jgi:hypothetical protein
MAVSGRHIRHDWQTFVDWPQKSVSTVCGRKSTFNYTGIPGVTDQDTIVEVKGKPAFGWCYRCSIHANVEATGILHGEVLHPYIRPMYEAVKDATQQARDQDVRRAQRDRVRMLRSEGLNEEQITECLAGRANLRTFKP